MKKATLIWVFALAFAFIVIFGSVLQLTAEPTRPLITKTITVKHNGAANQQGIRTWPHQFMLVEGDIIKVTADPGVWCTPGGPGTGDIKIEVKPNDCGFATMIYHITEGGAQTITLTGTATANKCRFDIIFTYTDNDCTAHGTSPVKVTVWCNRGVPSLTQWGLIILVGLIIISGLWLWKKKRVRLAA